MRAVAPAPAAPPQPSTQVAPVDFGQRLIVRTGSLVLLVDDVADASSRARDLAESAGGFVVSSVQREENGKPAASVTVRVPADRFDSVLEKLKGLAVRVSNEQVSSRDITEEFVDTDARLRNLKATEARYLDLLQQARTVEDVLKVEQQLSNIRGQIEQLQGRLQFLQRSSETSTITLELRPFVLSQPTSPADWSLLPVFRGAWAAFLGTVQLLVSALVWVAIFAPIWLPLGFLLWRWRRRHALPAVVAAAQSTPAA